MRCNNILNGESRNLQNNERILPFASGLRESGAYPSLLG